MNNTQRILNQIVSLTSTIESNYPELYRILDENPMTIPTEAHPDLGETTLMSYLEGLKELVKHHLLTHNAVIR